MKKYFCAALIVFGIALDTYFYAFRFLADGLPMIIAISAGLALELLLAFAVYNAQRAKVFALIAIAITGYAVVQTSAGQTFALLSHTADAGLNTSSSTADFTLDECKKTIARLSNEADTINAQLRSLQSAQARAAYAGTIARANERLREISAERNRNMNLLLKTSSTEVSTVQTSESRKSIYNFYASMPSWKGDDWLKFIFHFVLSLLIAIMAPVGIISYGGHHGTPHTSYTRQQIETFVAAAWYRIRHKTGEHVLSEMQYNELLQKSGRPVESGIYFTMTNKCIQYGLINTSGIAIEKDHQKVVKILAGEKESKIAAVQKFFADYWKKKNAE